MEIFILTVILVLIFLTFYSKQNFTNVTFETDLEQRFKQMVDKIEKSITNKNELYYSFKVTDNKIFYSNFTTPLYTLPTTSPMSSSSNILYIVPFVFISPSRKYFFANSEAIPTFLIPSKFTLFITSVSFMSILAIILNVFTIII